MATIFSIQMAQAQTTYNTENLASGVYSYSIIVDGKSVDTKKMVRNR
ncbi:MAG TPA: hypothetical protein VII99_00570 [Bacteroidia bacterium]